MSAYTQGPWRWQRGERYWRLNSGTEGKPGALRRVLVADLKSGNEVIQIVPSDARLIAKAPEMARTIRELIDLADDGAFLDLADIEATPISRKLRAILREIEGACAI